MICDDCLKAKRDKCEKDISLKPKTECLIVYLEKIKREMIQERDSVDLSCADTFNWNIRLIDKYIAKLKGENSNERCKVM